MLLRILRTIVRMGWPLRLVSPLFGRFNPFLPSHFADPYPQYRRLREGAPVYRHPLFGAWVLSRHEDITEVLKDARFSVDRAAHAENDFINPFVGLDPGLKEVIVSTLLMKDPPDHTRLRGLVNKAFTPRRIEGLRPRIQEVVDEFLDEMQAGGDVEFMRDFAVPLPIVVIAELLGVPSADREAFKQWSSVLAALLDPVSSEHGLDELNPVFLEMQSYFDTLFEERRRNPQNDLVSALVAAEEEGEMLSSTECLATCALILGAGHETTTNLLGNAVVALLRNPEERKRLTEDPGLIDTAVEEFLRFDSPVQVTDRVALEDCEIAGHSVKAGSFVLLLLGSANRDPAQFERAEQLDLGRRDNRHLAFSQGVHFCLGAQLARVEAQVAIGSFLRRFPEFNGPLDPPAWRRSLVLRGPESLPLQI